MPNIWDGTYLWIWYANQIQGGNLNAILAKAKSLGISGVLIKFADGDLVNDPVSQGFMQQFKALVGPFKHAGFRVGGWIYQYLTNPAGEVDACSQAIEAGADWIVLDAETDVYDKNSQVQQFGQMLRSRYPSIPIGLSSFAITNYHTQVPYAEYAAFTDVMMPQMYWAEIGWDVAVTVHASLASYQKFGKPIAPTGQAFGSASTADMQRFVQLAIQAKLTGISWWDWQHATSQQLQAIEQNILHPPGLSVQPSNTIAKDVASSSWYAPAVSYVLKNGIMTVDSTGKFKPEEAATRAEMAQVLLNEYNHKLLQLPTQTGQDGTGTGTTTIPKAMDIRGTDTNTIASSSTPTSSYRQNTAKDVAPSSWYATAVQYVLQHGIMHLDAYGNFYPDQAATRALLAQVIFNEHNQ